LVDRVSVASTLDARNVRPLLTRINVNMPLPAEAACGFALLLAASQAQAADVESGRRLAQQRFLHAAVTSLVRAADRPKEAEATPSPIKLLAPPVRFLG